MLRLTYPKILRLTCQEPKKKRLTPRENTIQNVHTYLMCIGKIFPEQKHYIIIPRFKEIILEELRILQLKEVILQELRMRQPKPTLGRPVGGIQFLVGRRGRSKSSRMMDIIRAGGEYFGNFIISGQARSFV